MTTVSVETLLAGKDAVVSETYARLIGELSKFGTVTEEANQSSVHLKAGADSSAFADAHMRKSSLHLNFRSDSAIRSDRIRKIERVSRNRVHHDLVLTSPSEIDAELLRWLRTAYDLASRPA